MSEKPRQPTPDALLKGNADPDIVDVPARLVLVSNGAGGPNSPGFSAAVRALYGISYTLRFARKKADRSIFEVGFQPHDSRRTQNRTPR